MVRNILIVLRNVFIQHFHSLRLNLEHSHQISSIISSDCTDLFQNCLLNPADTSIRVLSLRQDKRPDLHHENKRHLQESRKAVQVVLD